MEACQGKNISELLLGKQYGQAPRALKQYALQTRCLRDNEVWSKAWFESSGPIAKTQGPRASCSLTKTWFSETTPVLQLLAPRGFCRLIHRISTRLTSALYFVSNWVTALWLYLHMCQPMSSEG